MGARAVSVHWRPMAGPNKKKRRRSRHRGDPQRAAIAAQREEARRRAREERRLTAIAAEKREKRLKAARRVVTWTVGGVALIALALFLFRPAPEVDGVSTPEELEATALAVGESFDYGTPTPTSGPYLEGDPTCGVFAGEMRPEDAVTALHYGAVVVWHDPELGEADVAALAALATDAETHVVVSPNASLDSPIVATAWNRLLSYEGAADVADFIDTYRKRGPDSADCPVS